MLILIWVWILTLWLGMMTKEESWRYATQSVWFGTQSVNDYRDAWRDLWVEFSQDFSIQAGYIFSTESDDWWVINVSRLMTISKWKDQCRASNLERIDINWNKVSDCWDWILQTAVLDNKSNRQFLKWNDDQILTAWTKMAGNVLIADDAILHEWNIVWIESFALNEKKLPTDLIEAQYTENWINLIVRKITTTWVSTVFRKKVDWTRTSSLGIWLTEDGSIFFEVDKIVYSTDHNITSPLYVSVVTQAKWAWLKNIDFGE